MDRRRAGNPGREGYRAGIMPRGRVINDTELTPPDLTAAPAMGARGLEGVRRAGSRDARINAGDEPNMPRMNDSSIFPELPGPRTVRRLKKGGKVAAKTKPAAKKKAKR